MAALMGLWEGVWLRMLKMRRPTQHAGSVPSVNTAACAARGAQSHQVTMSDSDDDACGIPQIGEGADDEEVLPVVDDPFFATGLQHVERHWYSLSDSSV